MEPNNLSVAIPFNMVYDIDFGVVRYIRDNYKDADIYNIGVLNMEDIFLKDLLRLRQEYNPVLLCLNDSENYSYADYIYENIISNHYSEVLEKSVKTAISDFISFLDNTTDGQITITIICRNNLEKEFIINDFEEYKNGKSYIINAKCNANMYDPIFVKSLKDLPNYYNNIGCNNIYLARYGFNIQYDEDGQELPKIDGSEIIFNENKCIFIDIYNQLEIKGE